MKQIHPQANKLNTVNESLLVETFKEGGKVITVIQIAEYTDKRFYKSLADIKLDKDMLLDLQAVIESHLKFHL